MFFLAIVVLGVGVLALLNLVFTLGVVRRLREHADQLAKLAAGHGHGGVGGLAVGAEPGEFEAETVDGTVLRRADLAEGTLMAFFSPGCEPCREMLPKFVEHLRADPRVRAVATVVADAESAESASFAERLRAVCPVVVERRGAALTGAFQVTAFPTVLRVGRDAAARLVVTDDQAEQVLLDPVAAP